MGNYYTVNSANTDRYKLIYYGPKDIPEEKSVVKEIKLSDALFNEALKNTFITKYLNVSTKSLVLENPASGRYENQIKLALDQRNNDLAMQLMRYQYIEKQLTASEFNAVWNWLCNS